MMTELEDIENCLQTLRGGGVILYPTDTIWGIGCDATNEEAASKIMTIKCRPGDKSFVVLVAEERDVLQYVAAPDLSVFDYLEKQLKPTTVIYDNALGLAPGVLAADGSAAIRICKDPFCRQLIKRLRKPIVSTSANFSGEPSPRCFSNINHLLKDSVDYVAHHRRSDVTVALPSAIVRWEKGEAKIIRP